MVKKRERRFSGTTSAEVSKRELENRKIALRAAEEGIVLMKNEGILPLEIDREIGLFGSGACCTVKGGTGSGDVCERETIPVYRGMKEAGFRISSERWIHRFEETYQAARLAWRDMILKEAEGVDAYLFFGIYASHPFQMPAGETITREDLGDADTAVYVISRVAGEGKDRTNEAGDYQLSENEKNDLLTLSGLCDRIVVLLNTGAQIDMTFLLSLPQIKAIVNISQPGMEGGNAVAAVLSGKATPSGKLTDTWAETYQDYPGSDSFRSSSEENLQIVYNEGIYVGYRYFDAFGKKTVFPFGFGLSYTEFDITGKLEGIRDNRICVSASVTNTGTNYSGKEVVQVYAACPQETPKDVKRLCAFGKTSLLAPGRSEQLALSFDMKSLAYFNQSACAWVVEKGRYYILLGNSSEALEVIGVLEAKEDIVLEEVAHICPLQQEIPELNPDPETAACFLASCAAAADRKRVQMVALQFAPTSRSACAPAGDAETEETICCNDSDGKTRTDLCDEGHYRELAKKIAGQLTPEQMIPMVIGEVSRGHDAALGAAGIMVPGAAGETSGILEKTFDIPAVSMADGPAGIRIMKEYQADTAKGEVYSQGILGALENGLFVDPKETVHPGTTTFYQYCTAFPVGVMLAQTWNPDVLEQVGRAAGIEMEEFGISWWLAPGMNIHRNPLCGRNFEYYSEDPLLSGVMAAAITNGVQSVPGVGTVIKHFACNNKEDFRMQSDSILSERALREIYLRGFEIAVRTSQPMCVMTSYNCVNGVHSANNYDLCTTVLRGEWDFAGIVMTDWTTTGKGGGSIPWKCAAAGNDLIMPGMPEDGESIKAALETGELTIDQLRACVERMLILILQTSVFEDCVPYGERIRRK